ncbi:hypothetical protein FB567DRAFT_463231 [Paraphoma chrysanthemicola]|uniref:F-box domain-containing protein n=1 Tax=Paraphoma chrysanthemicola TaxID=798071 RepID=A0A8K0RFP9_9PLEO|nr:hypothetical protein FB567DRAFT_463231 [Paraphoma chrysanthemicola]
MLHIEIFHVDPWSTSFDWNLRATQLGETRLPFRYHIHNRQKETQISDDEFHRFLQLPIEIQQYILTFCNAATLFQLMHVSFTMRQEAKKLFWSDPTSRYVVDGQWLLAGGHPRLTNDDLEALTHIQYVEVDFFIYRSSFVEEWTEGGYHCDIHEGEKERAVFWKALRRRFPCVTDVVLTVPNSKRLGAPAPENATRLATGSPDDISISVSQPIRCGDHWASPLSRHLWRRNHSNRDPSTWELIETSWSPRRITPPSKNYSGPVGAYQLYDYHDLDLRELEVARQIHTIQAIEAYHVHILRAPCVCPFPKCGMQFEQPGEWTVHYRTTSARYHDGLVPLPPWDSVRTAFDRHDASLELKRQRISHELAVMRAAWGEPDSSERSTASQQFLQQLRTDPLYAGDKAPEQSEIWFRYERDMNVI